MLPFKFKHFKNGAQTETTTSIIVQLQIPKANTLLSMFGFGLNLKLGTSLKLDDLNKPNLRNISNCQVPTTKSYHCPQIQNKIQLQTPCGTNHDKKKSAVASPRLRGI